MLEYIIKQAFWRDKNPEEFKEIWKDVTLRLIVKDKGGKKHCLPICWFQPVGLDIFWENIRKRVCWNRRWRIICTLSIGFWRKFHLHFTLMFSLRYFKMMQSLYKSWLLVSKITWGIWTTSTSSGKSKKLKIDMEAQMLQY